MFWVRKCMKCDVINCKRKIFGSCGYLYYINIRFYVSFVGVNVGIRIFLFKGFFFFWKFYWVLFEGIIMMLYVFLDIFLMFSFNLFSWIFLKKRRSKKKFNFVFLVLEIYMWLLEWVCFCDEIMVILIFFFNYLMSW